MHTVFTSTQDITGTHPGTAYGPDRPVHDMPNPRRDKERLEKAIKHQRDGLLRVRGELAAKRDRVNSVYATPAMHDPEIMALSNHDIPAMETRVRAIEADLAKKERNLKELGLHLESLGERELALQKSQDNVAVAAAMGEALMKAGITIGDMPDVVKSLRDSRRPEAKSKPRRRGRGPGRRKKAEAVEGDTTLVP